MFSHFRIRANSRHAGRFSLAESAAGLTDLNGKKIKAKALQAVGAAHLDCAYASNQVRHFLPKPHLKLRCVPRCARHGKLCSHGKYQFDDGKKAPSKLSIAHIFSALRVSKRCDETKRIRNDSDPF